MRTTNKPETVSWLSPADAASALGITTRSLARLADDGVIRAIKPGGTQRRYAAEDIEAILSREPWEPAR